MNILHVDSSIQGDNSASRRLSAAVVGKLTQAGGAKIVYRDLAASPVAHLSPAFAAAVAGLAGEIGPELQADLADSGAALEEFLAADVVVIGAPMYNYTVPSQLKAWIDRLLAPGKTFRYTEKGVEGLAGGKRVILVSSRGNIYSEGTPLAAIDHHERLILSLFAMIGITDVEIVRAEGLALSDAHRVSAMAAAEAQIAALAVA
ncbi:FMN-dependent NADH-azoreductase [Sphingobium sp. 22B]|uniref:FMN-dependent NADH-azoreductase n=1 Tax=unclassified Sphingobium TaxID=2611147 RepID=UPI0007825AD4|nr:MULTISPECIES: NAD(P)H-dependent oxidoreductase [unclassified Sphingobium]KXU29425.1 FMN-dependent NADH-azoreductase [Sphingobium sp. AM]KYC30852.1 FMN-dependent NADH-azoreductase [Sphingobium sp. 22B]OAP29385.1 FMN-dependent NADH-azoreductase [Sphingobium sp. 20006FA]